MNRETQNSIASYLALHPDCRAERLEGVENDPLKALAKALKINPSDHDWKDRRNIEQAILGALAGISESPLA